jgi:hypothetical protein
MNTIASWELRSSSGLEAARWSVTEVQGLGERAIYFCDVSLEGRYFGATLGSGRVGDPKDFGLAIRGLQLGAHELQRLSAHLHEWLSLPAAKQNATALELSCAMGSLFDQSLRLALGARSDTLAGGRPVATLQFRIGRMQGEFTYVVDPICLRILAEGIDEAMHRTPNSD